MSTDPLPIAQALIRAASVTPADDGAIAVVEAALRPLGFALHRLPFGPPDYRVENLFARRGTAAPFFCYAGHTDVVPPGDETAWTDPPFAAAVRDGVLYGRGACDMKGGVAAFLAALTDFLAVHPRHPGSIGLLITGDEEARAEDGTARVLEWMAAHGHLPDMALVGEPTSRRALGDTIKVGRRGSMTAHVTVHGKQGHSAYPDGADNPIHRLLHALHALLAAPLDDGTEWFAPSTLQVTGFDVGNATGNVIPATARAMVNIRFNDRHTSAALTDRLHAALRDAGARYDLRLSVAGESFRTEPGPFVDALRRAVRRSTGLDARLDTGGGTSDARFLARHCPVAELGGVGETPHQVDERVPVSELRALAALYAAVLEDVLV